MPSHFAPNAITSRHGLGPLKVCEALHVFACAVLGTGAPPTVSVPVTAALPATVKFPARESVKPLMLPLVVIELNVVGCEGSFGKITSRTCRVVIDGPEISITYLPGAA